MASIMSGFVGGAWALADRPRMLRQLVPGDRVVLREATRVICWGEPLNFHPGVTGTVRPTSAQSDRVYVELRIGLLVWINRDVLDEVTDASDSSAIGGLANA